MASHEYRLVVLSDHGQSQGATFLQRYGESLEDLVTAACEARDTHVDAGREDDAVSYLSAGLTGSRATRPPPPAWCAQGHGRRAR